MVWNCSADSCEGFPFADLDSRSNILQPYQHINKLRSSLQPSQIRILLLRPGTAREPIYGTLWRGSIEDSPQYEALSYRWQDISIHSDCREVSHIHIIDGADQRPFPISESLWEALIILRQDESRDRALWIDQISINQTDEEEKSGQVPNMGRIYKEAKKTVIWLGTPTLQDDLAVGIINSFREFRRQLEKLLDEQGTEYSPQMRLGLIHALSLESPEKLANRNITSFSKLPVIGEAEIQAILTFYQKSWFTRMWPLQEVVLSKDKEVFCGDQTLEWKDVIFFATWLMHRDVDLTVNPELAIGIKAVNYTNFYATTYDSGFELLPMLRATRAYAATDSRDKVFALVNMIDFSKTPSSATASTPMTGSHSVPTALRADYRKEPIDVCADLAEYLIASRNDLAFLSLQDHIDPAICSVDKETTREIWHQELLNKATESNNVSKSSWVPFWNRKEMSAPIWLPEANAENFNAIGNSLRGELMAKTMTCKHQGSTHRILKVRGVDVGRLKRQHDVNVKEEENSLGDGRGKREWGCILYAIEIELSKHPRGISFGKSNSKVRDFLMQLAVTLTAGRVKGGAILDLSDAEALSRHMEGFGSLVIELSKDIEHSNSSSDSPLKALREYIQQQYPQLPETGTQSEYSHALFEACRNRSLFITENGMMGLGPCCALPGDRVCLLRGCRVPFLLRKDWGMFKKNLKGAHKLVGECYLYGAMDGELASQVASTDSLEIFALV